VGRPCVCEIVELYSVRDYRVLTLGFSLFAFSNVVHPQWPMNKLYSFAKIQNTSGFICRRTRDDEVLDFLETIFLKLYPWLHIGPKSYPEKNVYKYIDNFFQSSTHVLKKNVYKYIDIFFQSSTHVLKKNVYKYIDNFFQTTTHVLKKMSIYI
jgi:hypothetical protein